MPTPSFDEILTRARQIADQNSAGPSTGERAAKGVSQFVSSILNASTGKREDVGGYLDPQGKYKAVEPYSTGGSLMQVLADRAVNGRRTDPIPAGSTPLTEEEGRKYATQSSLQNQKYDALYDIAGLRAKAMAKAAGGKITTTTQPVAKEVSDYFWKRFGKDPVTEPNLPILTYGAIDRLSRAEGLDTNSELKNIGYEISLNKDPLFGVQPGDRTRIQGRLDNAGKGKVPAAAPVAPAPASGRISVTEKSTGKTGSIPINEFDPTLYKKN